MSTYVLLGGGLVVVVAVFVGFMRLVRGEYYFYAMFFVDREAVGDRESRSDAKPVAYRGTPNPTKVESVLWVEERMPTSGGGGFQTPQLTLLSLAASRRSVIWTGRDREIAFLVDGTGPFLWWWSSKKGLHTRDRMTGALLLDEPALLAKMPELQGKLIAHGDFRACDNYAQDWPGGIRVRTNDARIWTIKGDIVAKPSAVPWVEARNEPARAGSEGDATVRDGTLRDKRTVAFGKGDRRTLNVGKRTLDGSYLEGALAYDVDNQRVLELDDPASVVVVHHDKLGSGAKLLLSRVLLDDGRAAWTRSDIDYRAVRDRGATSRLAYAALRSDGLYFVINRYHYCVVVVNPQTGDVRQRFPK